MPGTRAALIWQDDDPGRVVEVRKCGDQRASRRFVFNELCHFLIADSWRSCGIASSVYILPSLSLFFLLLQGASDSPRTRLRQLQASAGKLRLFVALWIGRAGTKLARRGTIETGLGAKQSTAVLGYPINSGSWRGVPNRAETQEKPAPLQKRQGRGTQRCLFEAGIDVLCCANAAPPAEA
jgi:hypothetical protein